MQNVNDLCIGCISLLFVKYIFLVYFMNFLLLTSACSQMLERIFNNMIGNVIFGAFCL